MNCVCCNNNLKNKGQKKFCTKSCSAKFNNKKRIVSENQKNKTRQTLLKKYKKKYCMVCSKELVENRHRKTCSSQCLRAFKTTVKPPLTSGGYRKGSGRGKHGWFDGMYFDSTWELAFYIYCKDHNINIIRCNEKFEYVDANGNKKMYYPDFRVNGKLTEIKGFYTQNVSNKIKAVNEPIDILYKTELQNIFLYVEKKTKLKIKNLYCLYGDPAQN